MSTGADNFFSANPSMSNRMYDCLDHDKLGSSTSTFIVSLVHESAVHVKLLISHEFHKQQLQFKATAINSFRLLILQ